MSGDGIINLGGGTNQHSHLGGGTTRLGGGTTQVRLQAVVPPRTGGGTARTLKFRGFKFLALNLNPFGAYKYPSYSCMDK